MCVTSFVVVLTNSSTGLVQSYLFIPKKMMFDGIDPVDAIIAFGGGYKSMMMIILISDFR